MRDPARAVTMDGFGPDWREAAVERGSSKHGARQDDAPAPAADLHREQDPDRR